MPIGSTGPWTNTKSLMFGDPAFLRLTYGFTLTGSTLTSSGLSKLTFTSVVSSKPALVGAYTEPKYFETKLASGNTLKRANNAIAVNVQTGYKTTTDSAADTIEATVLCTWAEYQALVTLRRSGDVVIVSKGVALKNEDASIVGYEHLCGIITALTPTPNGEGMYEVAITVAGGVTYVPSTGATYTEFIACSTGTANKVQPDAVANVEYEIKDLTSETYATLMTGIILFTDPS